MITGASNIEQLGEDPIDRSAIDRSANDRSAIDRSAIDRSAIYRSAEEKERKHDSLAMQTEEDSKPFLKFLLSAQDIDKEDLKLLKKKIAELNKREI